MRNDGDFVLGLTTGQSEAQDRALDEALQMTFPASDPVAITPASSENRKGDER